MKQLIIFLLLLSAPTMAVMAQENPKQITYTTYFGTGIAMSEPSHTPFNWQAMAHYHIGKRWNIGAGTGISVYEKVLIPLYASTQFFITKSNKLAPYIECNLGGAFATEKKVRGGFYLSPSIGMQVGISQVLKINLAIGYELQKLKRTKGYTDEYFRTEIEEQLSHHSIAFKIGLTY